MGCGIYWQQVHEVERALDVMERYGIPETDPAYQKLYGERGELLARVGQKFPRVTASYGMWREFSPARVRLWHDIESGWMAEAREKPGAPPIYRSVSDEVAMAILKDELTPELVKELLKPEEYIGE